MVLGHGLDRDYGRRCRLGLDPEEEKGSEFEEGLVQQKRSRPRQVFGSMTGLWLVGRMVELGKRYLCMWFEGLRSL